MPYTCRVFGSIDDVDLAAWECVRSESGASIFMDTRFVACVQTSMTQCRFRYVIVDDDTGRPVACAGLTAMAIDLTDFANPLLAWVIKRAPNLLSKFRTLRVLFCSLPGSPGEKSLALTSTSASAQILSTLDRVVHDLATSTGMDAIVYKEFGESDLEWINPLLDLGYRRIPFPPMHAFQRPFSDFAQYCAALKPHYRKQIDHSMRKLKNAGIRPSVLSDPAEILKAYTPDVHAMYCAMVAKSNVKLEVLPIEYFHGLATHLAGDIDLITLSKDSRIVGFGWCLRDGSTYHLMYAGLDYRLNRESDLYFNLMYASFDRAFRKGVARINVGQTGAMFKGKMGCHSEPLCAFAKGLGPFMSRFIDYGASLIVIRKSSNPPFHIFKSGSPTDPK